MKSFDQNEFQELITKGQNAEAEVLLADYLNQDLTDEEKGGFYTELAMGYIAMSNEINSRYLEALEEIIQSINENRKLGKEYEKQIDINALKKQIESL